jgi:hypothetical protein
MLMALRRPEGLRFTKKSPGAYDHKRENDAVHLGLISLITDTSFCRKGSRTLTLSGGADESSLGD